MKKLLAILILGMAISLPVEGNCCEGGNCCSGVSSPKERPTFAQRFPCYNPSYGFPVVHEHEEAPSKDKAIIPKWLQELKTRRNLG